MAMNGGGGWSRMAERLSAHPAFTPKKKPPVGKRKPVVRRKNSEQKSKEFMTRNALRLFAEWIRPSRHSFLERQLKQRQLVNQDVIFSLQNKAPYQI